MDTQKLKRIRVELEREKQERNLLFDQKRKIERQIELKNIGIRQREKQIEDLRKGSGIVISEHAILRYLERVGQIDMERIKSEILPEEVGEICKRFGGNGKFPTKTHQVIVKNNIVTTVTLE